MPKTQHSLKFKNFKKYVIIPWCLISNFYFRKFIIKSLLLPFLPVFTQKPSCGLVFKAVAVFLFTIITEKWNTLIAIFSSPHFPELYLQYTAQKSAGKCSCEYMPTVHFKVIWRKNEEKTKFFYEDFESVFGFSIGCTVSTQ